VLLAFADGNPAGLKSIKVRFCQSRKLVWRSFSCRRSGLCTQRLLLDAIFPAVAQFAVHPLFSTSRFSTCMSMCIIPCKLCRAALQHMSSLGRPCALKCGRCRLPRWSSRQGLSTGMPWQ
jgi:hypothetical protein